MSVSDWADGGCYKIYLSWVCRQIELFMACGSIFCDQTQVLTLNPTQYVTDEVYGFVMTTFCMQQAYFIIFIIKYNQIIYVCSHCQSIFNK